MIAQMNVDTGRVVHIWPSISTASQSLGSLSAHMHTHTHNDINGVNVPVDLWTCGGDSIMRCSHDPLSSRVCLYVLVLVVVVVVVRWCCYGCCRELL